VDELHGQLARRSADAANGLHQGHLPAADPVPRHRDPGTPDDEVFGACLAVPAEGAGSPHAVRPRVYVLQAAPAPVAVLIGAVSVLAAPSELAPVVHARAAEPAMLQIPARRDPHGAAERPLWR
jgi:hypothetical protein